ncbi:MAG: preprotein translocase subunit SecG [Desulfobulbaceae bacterium]|nr:preprotein translocase subunit SecG [Desulfobulbaceae bacterium]HIJ91015.1 preprotein translocase subunit SecG [Deltaproteobacteria bacterium]
MTTLLTIVHIVVCLFLVVIVLLQQGKGASMGASFGGSSQTVFGTEGPLPLLNKITTWAAVIFMLTSISLAYMSSRVGDGSVMKEVVPVTAPQSTPIPLPAADGAAPQAPVQGN